MRPVAVPIVSLLILSPNLLRGQTTSPPTLEKAAARIDEYMSAAVKADHFSGSILVAKDGNTVVSRGFGMANYELQVPNTAYTVFRIASLTKAFTATAIMRLREQGRLKLSDPICTYLAGCPQAWQRVTIKHLLTHTSGIPNYTSLPGYEATAGVLATNDEIVSRFREKPLEFTPGDRFKYSNSGYHLLGLIIEKASGQSYGDYLGDVIFLPLGMKNTGVDDNKMLLENRAAGYALANGTLLNASYQEMTHLHAEGGLYSTTNDLLAFEQSLYTQRILSRKSLDEMFVPFKGTYGYGWNITRLFDRRENRHSGLNLGFSSHIKRFPDDRVTVIVLSNNQMVDAERIATDLSAIVFGAPYTVPREGVTVDERVLRTYTGKYRISPTTIVSVTLEGGRLFGVATGQGKSEMFALSENEFFVKNAQGKINFNKDASGRVIGMSMSKGARVTYARKVDAQ